MHKPVKIYTLSTCSHCKATKELLNDYNVAYDYVDVDLLDTPEKSRVLEEVAQFNPRRTFPTTIINGAIIIVGYREDEIKEALDL
ncbi:MAG TPA: glutaredoxin family protein [Deltaproteobacteria bacterium]|mgnify:CR=1 FL=1|nr:glutaredoxin family protein [Deltaproteobacteria bacterium]